MKYFSLHDPADKERSRSFEGTAFHKKEIWVPDWISVALTPDLGGYFFTNSEFGPSQIIYKFHAACHGDTDGVLSGLKNIHGELKILSFMWFFLCHNWNLPFHLHCMIQGNSPKIILVLGLLERTIQNLQRMQLCASTVNNSTTLTEELTTIVSDKGLRISDNQGSGNCMFHALSEQLEIVKGIKIQHGQLRQSLVQYLMENPKLVSCCNSHK